MPNILEVACDESGAEGENVAQAAADMVFAHGSTDLDTTTAASFIDELRSRTRTQSSELKSSIMLRPTSRGALEWALSQDSPLWGHGSVALVDKQYFLVSKMVDLLVEELAHERGVDLYRNGKARQMAWRLYREGERDLGPDLWASLLQVFNSVMRMKQRQGSQSTVDEMYAVVAEAARRSHRRNVTDVLELIGSTRAHADDFKQFVLDEPEALPSLDPVAAAIPVTARYWYEQTRADIVLVHDRLAMLTPARIKMMVDYSNRPGTEFVFLVGAVPLRDIRLVDSKDDPRVQVADLLAGVGRWAGRHALMTGDQDAASLARPFISPASIWADVDTFKMLTGRAEPGK